MSAGLIEDGTVAADMTKVRTLCVREDKSPLTCGGCVMVCGECVQCVEHVWVCGECVQCVEMCVVCGERVQCVEHVCDVW